MKVVCKTMVERNFLGDYILDFFDDSLVVTVKQVKRLKIVLYIFLSALFLIPFSSFCICISVIALMAKQYFYAVIFSFMLLFIDWYTIGCLMYSILISRKFKFVIDKNGVTHNDINKTYYLSWNEISSYGYVNNNYNCLQTYGDADSAAKQIVLYFSTKTHTKKYLRNRFNQLASNPIHKHCSKKGFISFCFWENDVDIIFIDKFNTCIELYIDKNKEISYIEE